MKLSKKQKANLLKTYKSYWDGYLTGDVKNMAKLLDNNYTQVGSAEAEVFSNKKDAVKFLHDTIGQVAGKAKIKNQTIKLEFLSDHVLVNDLFDIYVLTDKEWVYYARLRASTLMFEDKGAWKFIHQHSSIPDMRTYDQVNLATEKISKENLELKDAIKRRTIDLEVKNRALEIEAVLERVRAKGMAMHKSTELQEVINECFNQLSSLEIDINYSTIITEKDKDITKGYDCWIGNKEESYAQQIHIPHMDHKVNHNFHNAWFKKKKSYQESYSKREKDLILNFQFKHSAALINLPKAGKKRIQDAPGLTGAVAIRSHIALSIVRYNNQAFSKDDMDILNRFAEVLEQTYTRFLDLQKAEAQAKEAQIEAALERVRAKGMAMHKSTELPEVIGQINTELLNLGVDQDNVSIITDFDSSGSNWWLATRDRTYPEKFYLPTLHSSAKIVNTIIAKYLNALNKGFNFYAEKYTKSEKNIFFKDLFKNSDLGGFSENIREYIFNSSGWIRSIVILKNSGLAMQRFSTISFTPKQNEILKRFGHVFEQSYTRFLDLQKAEAQAKEAQIEAALERVRAASMAMHHSEELSETIVILFNQLNSLGIEIESSWVSLINEKENYIEIWPTHKGVRSKAVRTTPENGPNFVNEMNAWKENIPFIKIQMSKEAITKTLKDVFDIELNATKDQITFHLLQIRHQLGFMGLGTWQEASEEEFSILQRFTQVFEQTYTRFLDLQKAEAQAREAQIEAALERVRAKSMAMHNTSELKQVIDVISQQFDILGINQELCMINIFGDKTNKDMNFWIATYPDHIHFPFFKHPAFSILANARKNNETFYAQDLNRNEKDRFFDHFYKNAEGIKIPQKRKNFIKRAPGMTFSVALSKYASIHIANYSKKIYTDEENHILQRIGNTFEQTYARFLALQKAEAQAREAQIEAALERVRAKSMAMHKSTELTEVIGQINTELLNLDVDQDNVTIITDFDRSGSNSWIANRDKTYPEKFYVPLIHSSAKIVNTINAKYLNALKKGFTFITENYTKSEKNIYLKHLFNNTDLRRIPENRKEYLFNTSGWSRSTVILKNSGLSIQRFSTISFTPKQNEILKRFGHVFEQSYTRFLDLQKAEEQAREAQIEAALERVRSKTMAMHNSHDVGVTVLTLFDEVLKLGLDDDIRCGIGILKGTKLMETRSATLFPNGEVDLKIGMLDMTIHPLLIKIKKAWKSGGTRYTDQLTGKDVISYYTALNNEPEYPFHVELDTLPEKEFHNSFFFSEGILFAFSPNPMSEEGAKVLSRFAQVYGQTYTRFLDLQKAEAQAREAQIEASLERVRAQAMAMHSSEDLVDTASQLFKELQQLNVSFIRCGVLKINKLKKADVYAYGLNKENEAVAVYGTLDFKGHEVFDGVFKHWQLQQEFYFEMNADSIKRYYKLINRQLKVPKVQYTKNQFAYAFYFPEGCLFCITNEKLPEETLQVLRRFNKVMGLTYRRYFELKDAEARELLAIKESSLDRVRAEIASMRTADDLNRITPLVWSELTTLGVPFFRCGVFIMDQAAEVTHAYLSTPSGKSLGALELKFDSMPLIEGGAENWRKQKIYIEEWDKKQFIKFTNLLLELGQIKSAIKYQGGKDAPEHLVLQMVPFKQGMMYVGSEESLSNDHLELVKSLADTFSTAYARYEDFKQLEEAKERVEDTLSELKSAQDQLVQSEKMASLGELTAGIAHEIQNPLNFVNNFSEVSGELLTELKEELEKGDMEEVKAISDDIIQNLEKINHHGQRASGIVKGMLAHSRSGSGEKELTDINNLADEYLRLAYHGLRAKDKSFNADFKLDLDESLPKIKVVPQDIGRVLLNLINNAFQACTERSRSTGSSLAETSNYKDYKPLVTVTSKKKGDTIEIRVKDNGMGIPDAIKDKIFEPFFTTKPSGEGTGLGLSMSYDIITKGHGGELKVESKVGKGSKFIVTLPNV